MSFSSADDWDVSWDNTNRSTNPPTQDAASEPVPATQPYVPPAARLPYRGRFGHESWHHMPALPPFIQALPPTDPNTLNAVPELSSLAHATFDPPFFQSQLTPSYVGDNRSRGRNPGGSSNQRRAADFRSQAFAKGREIGVAQAELQNLREERDRLQRELNQGRAEKARIMQDLANLSVENAHLRGQLHELRQSKAKLQSPRQVETATRKLSVTSAKSTGTPSPRKHSISSPSHHEQDLDIKQTLNTLFEAVEDWAARYLTWVIDDLRQAPMVRDVAIRVINSRELMDLFHSPTLRKFLAAAIINDEILKVLGGPLLQQLSIFSTNNQMIELHSQAAIDPDSFDKRKELLEKRALLVKSIAKEPEWMADAETKIEEMTTGIIRVFTRLIPRNAYHTALNDLKELMRKALAAALEMMAMPREWVVHVAKRGDRWEPHSMIEVDGNRFCDDKLCSKPYLFQVRFGVRPSITEKEYDASQKVREVLVKTVLVMHNPSPPKSPQKPPPRGPQTRSRR